MRVIGKATRFILSIGVATIIAAGLSFAKSHNVNVIYHVKVGTQAQLAPGTYRVHLIQASNSTDLAFFKNNRQVAKVPVTIKPENRKNQYTEIDYNKVAKNDHVITAIRLGGWNEEFVMPSGPGASTSKPMGSAAATKSSS